MSHVEVAVCATLTTSVVIGWGRQMRRREFVTLLAGTAAWPLGAGAQPGPLPIVAFINGGEANAAAPFAAAFRKGLSETGYVDGQNVAMEYHWLEGRYDLLPTLVTELIQRRVFLIATPGSTPAALAAKSGTATIPIVFGVPEDPVALGLVASLARPGGNATGVNFFGFEINAKRFGLMHELLPAATRFAVLLDPANGPGSDVTLKELQRAAKDLRLQIQVVTASTPGEIDAAFATLAHDRPDALFIQSDGFFASRRVQLATLAARERIPASYFAKLLAILTP